MARDKNGSPGGGGEHKIMNCDFEIVLVPNLPHVKNVTLTVFRNVPRSLKCLSFFWSCTKPLGRYCFIYRYLATIYSLKVGNNLLLI